MIICWAALAALESALRAVPMKSLHPPPLLLLAKSLISGLFPVTNGLLSGTFSVDRLLSGSVGLSTDRLSGTILLGESLLSWLLNPFRTAVPLWGQTTSIHSSLPLTRDSQF